MKYSFYGWQQADVPPAAGKYKNIRDPRDLYDRLAGIWCADTCAPRMRDEWSPENRTLGQCSITAFLAQDVFGGKVYGVLRPGGNYHCYNAVGDCVFDLTSEQFGDEKLFYGKNPEQFREVHFAKEEKRLRYEYLKKSLDQQMDLHERFEFRRLHTDEIEQVVAIEQECFPPNEAGRPEVMRARMAAAADSCLVAVDRSTGMVAGLINGIRSEKRRFCDDFFTDPSKHDPKGHHVMIAGVEVRPSYRMQGLAREMMHEYLQMADEAGCGTAMLTCLPDKVEMYRKFGFEDRGLSESTWGGEVWHEMACEIS